MSSSLTFSVGGEEECAYCRPADGRQVVSEPLSAKGSTLYREDHCHNFLELSKVTISIEVHMLTLRS